MAPDCVLRVLYLEASVQDAAQVNDALAKSRHGIAVTTVYDIDGFLAALENGHWNLVLMDYALHSDPVVGHALGELGAAPPVVLLGNGESRQALSVQAACVLTRHELSALVPLLDHLLHAVRQNGPERDFGMREGKLRAVFDANIIGILYAHRDGLIFDANDAFLRLSGHSRRDVEEGHLNWVEMTPPEVLETDLRNVARVLAGERIEPYESQLIHKDGHCLDVLVCYALLEGANDAGVAFLLDITEQKRNERAIEMAGQFHLAILDSLSQHLCIIDETGRILEVNRAWRRFAQAQGVDVGPADNYFEACRADFTFGEYAERALTGMRDVLQGKADMFTMEYPCETATRRYTFRMAATPLETPDGIRLVISHDDITERKDAEEALAASDQFYRATLNALNTQVCILDESGVILAVNQAWSEFGGSNGLWRPVVGENYFAQCKIQGLYRDRALEGIRQVLTRQRELFMQDYPLHDGERRRWFHMTVTRFERPGMIRLVMTHEDITERLEAEEAIKALTGQTRSLLDNMSDLAFMKDTELRYMAINEPAAAFCKISPEDIVGKTDFDLFPEAVALKFRRDDERVLQSGQRILLEEEIGLEDGSTVWLETVKTPIRDPDGRIIGMTGISRDITRRKEAESMLVASHDHLEKLVSERTAELEKANRTLQENERLRSNFVSALTHDLRTPLIAQKRLIELLKDMGESGRDKQDFLMHGLEKNNENLLDMVNKLLETYQYVEGRIVLVLEQFNLVMLVEECFQEMKEIAEDKQIRLSNAIGVDLFPVTADRGLLKRVLINLIGNAIENIPEYCEITLSAHRHADSWGLCVADNGMGISSELLPNLFERYFPRSTGQHRKIGSGLGLFICKMIVELHEGEIKVESNVGQGATFCITIPDHLSAALGLLEDGRHNE